MVRVLSAMADAVMHENVNVAWEITHSGDYFV